MDRWPGRAAELAELRREVTRLTRELAAHEHEHETAERAREAGARERERTRRATRRYWISTIAVVLSSQLGQLLILAATHHA